MGTHVLEPPKADGDASEFDIRARQFGHDPKRLARGEVIETHVLLPSLQGGSYLTAASPAELAMRAQYFFNPTIRARRRLGQGVHDRCEAVAYGGHTEIAQSDLDGLAVHLPFNVRATSLRDKTVRAGETWDLTIDGEALFDISYRDDVIAVLNVGTLRLEPGARIIVRGNLFFFLCQHLVIEPAPMGAEDFHIGILPTPFSVDFRTGPTDGEDGRDGHDGVPGNDGRILQLSPSLLGPQLMHPPEPGQLDGTPGTDGLPGTHGDPARTGGAAKLAEVIIRRLSGNLVVRGEGGRGGKGGDGGNGGHGREGGNAMPGARTRQGPIRGGAGGDGGHGGRGGDGGKGGNGGIASNIYVTVPETQTHQVRLVAKGGKGGAGGAAGISGSGGKGGAGGAGDRPEIIGPDGKNGSPGAPAKPGNPGRDRPAPPMFLNERPATFEFDPPRAAVRSGATT
ncbi:hypothetical protein [Gymnodinialimonas sp.]